MNRADFAIVVAIVGAKTSEWLPAFSGVTTLATAASVALLLLPILRSEMNGG